MIAIIQARSNSSRFKKKVLYKLNGIPIILHVINRVKKCKDVKKIIVATSKNKTDNDLVKFLKNLKIEVFRGDLNNVATRMYLAAKIYNAKKFIRICGDSPLIDYYLINRAIKLSKKKTSYDLITNLYPRTFPKGHSVEIIRTSILKKYIRFMSKIEKEHVTQFFYNNKTDIKIFNFKKIKKYKYNNYSVDYKRDLKIIKKILRDD